MIPVSIKETPWWKELMARRRAGLPARLPWRAEDPDLVNDEDDESEGEGDDDVRGGA
jgi:hypothetical protein